VLIACCDTWLTGTAWLAIIVRIHGKKTATADAEMSLKLRLWLGRDLLVFLHEKIADRVRHNLLGISNGSQVSNILWMVSQAAILGC